MERTAEQLAPSDDEQAQQLATAVGKVFRDPVLDAAVARQTTLLEALQAGIAGKLAILDHPDTTGTGQSSAQLPGVPGGMLAETLAGNLVREIIVCGSQGGPLAPPICGGRSPGWMPGLEPCWRACTHRPTSPGAMWRTGCSRTWGSELPGEPGWYPVRARRQYAPRPRRSRSPARMGACTTTDTS